MSKFKVGDKVRVVKKGKQSWVDVGREFTVTMTGNGWVEGHGRSTSGHEDGGVWDDILELVEVESKAAEEPEFKVGDVVEVKPGARWVTGRGEEVISELKVGSRIGGGEERYAVTDKHPGGVWLDNIKLARSAAEKAAEEREKAFQSLAVGDLVEVSKGDRKIVDRVQAINQVWRASAGDLSLGYFTILPNTSVKFYRETGWDIRVIEKAPEPEPERVLPKKPGLYVSQHLVIFALTEGGQWREARGKGQSYLPGVVKYETLREDKHFPLLPLHESSTPK